MTNRKLRYGLVLLAILELMFFLFFWLPNRRADQSLPSIEHKRVNFEWPDGKLGAVSLSFDDARISQYAIGQPILDRFNVKATFFVRGDNLKKRIAEWKAVVGAGHEIGNHTMTHPCSINESWTKDNAIEDYSLERILQEIDSTQQEIKSVLGVKALSFAYPCGITTVGRGIEVKSYIPLVAERFFAARSYGNDVANNPVLSDLYQLMSINLDGLEQEEALKVVRQGIAEGRWVIFAGHDIGEGRPQTTFISTLEAICSFAKDPKNGVWIDPVAVVAQYVAGHRSVVVN